MGTTQAFPPRFNSVQFDPPPHAHAAASSWWAETPREGFTARAWQEWSGRMRQTKYAHISTLTRGPSSADSVELYRARKAMARFTMSS